MKNILWLKQFNALRKTKKINKMYDLWPTFLAFIENVESRFVQQPISFLFGQIIKWPMKKNWKVKMSENISIDSSWLQMFNIQNN